MRIHHEHRRAPDGGFTLLELIVVVTLLALISVAVMPVYVGAMNATAVRNAQSDLLATLRFIQEVAVKESREYRLYLSEKEGKYWVMRLAGLEDNEKQFEEVEEEYGKEKTLPEGLVITRIKARKDGNAHFIACLPNGASDQATIALRDEKRRGRATITIEVKGVLGKVGIKQ
jgi:prepilin-type N-terminal cleavage/methylation domain-containing protein